MAKDARHSYSLRSREPEGTLTDRLRRKPRPIKAKAKAQAILDKKRQADKIQALAADRRGPHRARTESRNLQQKKAALSNFLERIADIGDLEPEEIANFQLYIRRAGSSAQLTDVHGEIVMAQFIRQYGGAPYFRYAPGPGIDGIVTFQRDGGRRRVGFDAAMSDAFPAVAGQRATTGLYIIETKGPGAVLGAAAGYGPQMSALWVSNNLRSNENLWTRINDDVGMPNLSRERDLSRGGHSESDKRINWVIRNTVPLLIHANPIKRDGALPRVLGSCTLLVYQDCVAGRKDEPAAHPEREPFPGDWFSFGAEPR